MQFRSSAVLFGLMLAVCSGCQAFHPPAPERDIAHAVGANRAIIFEKRVLPDDVAAPVSGTLTLEQAVARALQSDATLQAALAKVRVAEAESAQTRLLPNPIVSVAFRLPEGGGQSIVDVSLAAEFLNLLKKPGEVKAADFRVQESAADAVVQALDVVSEVRTRYSAVQASEAILPVLEERKRLLDRLVNIAGARLREGEGTRLDLTTVETQQVELQVEITQQHAARQEARVALARVIGRPSDEGQWNVTRWQAPAIPRATKSEWVQVALANRPELASKRMELMALGVEERIAKMAVFDGSEIGVDSERDGTWSVGPAAAFPLPLFDWGQAQRAKFGALRLQTAHELTATRRKVIEEVRTAWLGLQAALEAHRMLENELVPLLEKRRSEADAQWKGGQSDVLPLILADQDLQAAKARGIEAEQKVTDGLVQLERAVGGSAYVPADGASESAKSVSVARHQRIFNSED
ncbi:MAG: TolC family protein [Phycisphaerae bacterium]